MPTVLEQTKKAVEVIEKYGFQSVISVNASLHDDTAKIHIYEQSELAKFDCTTITAEERESDFGKVFVELDGVEVFTLIEDTKLLTA